MARPSKPWWWAARKRWAATIDGVRRVAPEWIGKGDVHGAWAWHREVGRKAEPIPTDTVMGLCELYLQWDEGRVKAGDRSARNHGAAVSALKRVCGTKTPGGKFGHLPIARVHPDHLDALDASWQAEGLSPGYRRALATAIKTMFGWAARRVAGRDALIPSNPFAGAPLPFVPAPAERYATRAEAAAWLRWLWRSGRRDFAQLQRVLIHTGARPSEITRATWGEIRWPNEPGKPAILTRAKWKAARKTGRARRVYLTARLLRMLGRRMGAPDEPMFTAPRGKPWRTSNLATTTTNLRGEAIKAGVPLQDKGADRLTNYRWRHTAASTLLMRGVPVSTVAELLGTSAAQIQRTYGHLLADHLADAAAKLARGGG